LIQATEQTRHTHGGDKASQQHFQLKFKKMLKNDCYDAIYAW